MILSYAASPTYILGSEGYEYALGKPLDPDRLRVSGFCSSHASVAWGRGAKRPLHFASKLLPLCLLPVDIRLNNSDRPLYFSIRVIISLFVSCATTISTATNISRRNKNRLIADNAYWLP